MLLDLDKETLKKFNLEITLNQVTIKGTDVAVIGIDLENNALVVKPFGDDKISLDDLREICLNYNIFPYLGISHWKDKLEITWEFDEEFSQWLINDWIDNYQLLVLVLREELNLEVCKKLSS